MFLLKKPFYQILCTVSILHLHSCSSFHREPSFWPDVESIYSATGERFYMNRISYDTVAFSMQVDTEKANFFWGAGKIIRRSDTIFFKLNRGNTFAPLFILRSKLHDSIVSRQPIRVDFGELTVENDTSLISLDTLDFMFEKLYEREAERDSLYVFRGWSSHLTKFYDSRFVVDSRRGIIGIWFLSCPDYVDEQYCITELGIGSFPAMDPYLKLPR